MKTTLLYLYSFIFFFLLCFTYSRRLCWTFIMWENWQWNWRHVRHFAESICLTCSSVWRHYRNWYVPHNSFWTIYFVQWGVVVKDGPQYLLTSCKEKGKYEVFFLLLLLFKLHCRHLGMYQKKICMQVREQDRLVCSNCPFQPLKKNKKRLMIILSEQWKKDTFAELLVKFISLPLHMENPLSEDSDWYCIIPIKASHMTSWSSSENLIGWLMNLTSRLVVRVGLSHNGTVQVCMKTLPFRVFCSAISF